MHFQAAAIVSDECNICLFHFYSQTTHNTHSQLQILYTFFLIVFLFIIFFFLFFLLFLFLFGFPALFGFPSLVVPLNVCRYCLHRRNQEYLKKKSRHMSLFSSSFYSLFKSDNHTWFVLCRHSVWIFIVDFDFASD